MMPASRIVTLAELAEHSTRNDAWIAIDGTVYDVTDFIPTHPGGNVILEGVGTDATVAFHKIDAHAQVQLKDYLGQSIIGPLESDEASTNPSGNIDKPEDKP